MPDKKLLILNKTQIQQKIDRMAYQIWEDNFNETELVIAGIVGCGYILSQRVKTVLEKISDIKVILVKVNLDKNNEHLMAETDLPIEKCANKVVIMVDDVLNSGRTFSYGMRVFLNVPIKKLRTLVLVDRSHRIFPVSTDFTGIEVATVLKEHVDVLLDEKGVTDAVYLR
jgi:pyrimidine operon attenuation protein/uracil phosphoribosyltransferase